jgi:hypothetical protein
VDGVGGMSLAGSLAREIARPSRTLASAPEVDFTRAMDETASRQCGGGLPRS